MFLNFVCEEGRGRKRERGTLSPLSPSIPGREDLHRAGPKRARPLPFWAKPLCYRCVTLHILPSPFYAPLCVFATFFNNFRGVRKLCCDCEAFQIVDFFEGIEILQSECFRRVSTSNFWYVQFLKFLRLLNNRSGWKFRSAISNASSFEARFRKLSET